MKPEASGVGQPGPRLDAPGKVTGTARYAADQPMPGLLHGVPLCSSIARGRLLAIEAGAALQLPGVLLVLTRDNAPRLHALGGDLAETVQLGEARLPLADDTIHYVGQYLGLVVADSYERAVAAAARVELRYAPLPPAVTIEAAMATAYAPREAAGAEPRYRRGDPERAFDEAPVKLKQTYRTPTEHHHPLEPPATLAVPSGDELVLYDSTQRAAGTRAGVAQLLGLPLAKVRVVSPFVGDGFGCKELLWPHTILAAVAAQLLKRPVRVVVARRQLATACGHRPETVQTLQLAASRDGTLRALMHSTLSRTSTVEEYCEQASQVGRGLYACDNVRTQHLLVRPDLPTPTIMRAPGEAPGLFALECGLDELAWHLGLDPVRLRQLNHADRDPLSGKPWSSKNLRECYRVGMEKIGWPRWTPRPRTLRSGRLLVGLGMATATLPGARFAQAGVRPRPEADGTAAQAFGAQFCEVHVDPDSGEVRVARHVSVLDVGQVGDLKMAQSQGYSGVIMGLGMALLEQTLYDPASGRPLNPDLAGYLLPTSADVGEIDIHFVGPPDPPSGELGGRGIGELALTGVAPAIANAVYHATGVRVRELPITPDKLLSMR